MMTKPCSTLHVLPKTYIHSEKAPAMFTIYNIYSFNLFYDTHTAVYA